MKAFGDGTAGCPWSELCSCMAISSARNLPCQARLQPLRRENCVQSNGMGFEETQEQSMKASIDSNEVRGAIAREPRKAKSYSPRATKPCGLVCLQDYSFLDFSASPCMGR
jgi:hypothetical protein